MAFLTILIVGLISYIDYGGNVARFVQGDPEVIREVPGPGYPGGPDPDEQLATAGGDDDEDLVVQQRQLHVRSDDPARGYAGQEQAAEDDTGADEATGAEERRRQFKLPKLPIPSDILDIPNVLPSRIKDIISDLPAVPTIPTDPGDIISQLPTDPGELISDLPIPTLPTIPAIPTLPVPVPIPTGIDRPKWPVPTVVPPGKPSNPEDPYRLPDLTELPRKIIRLLHDAISKLSANPDTPKYWRDVLRLMLRILNRVAGGDPKPWPPPSATLPLPLPTGTKLPPIIPTKTLTVPTVPLPTVTVPTIPGLLPRPTLTLPHRAGRRRQPGAGKKLVRDEGGGDGPLGDEGRKELRSAVSDEVWAAVDWSNPLVAPLTAAAAMVAFDAVYSVAEKWQGTDDEAERERLLDSFVVIDDDVLEAGV